ncbi:MAG: class II glutamine amidotransferase [Candidatus Helarchaeota archaeon]
MCGIAGILSKTHSTQIIPNLLTILSNLLDRGIDGTGIGYFDSNGKIIINKKDIIATKFTQDYWEEVDCKIAIGHVRRPTIGEISDYNSHPLMDCHENIAVIHNGTIENYHSLKQDLVSGGHIFRGTVDSEVIPHLIEAFYEDYEDLGKSIQKTVECLKGYYTFSVISNFEPNSVYLYRHHFPLVLVKDEESYYFSSERKPLAQLLNKPFRATHLKKGEMKLLSLE